MTSNNCIICIWHWHFIYGILTFERLFIQRNSCSQVNKLLSIWSYYITDIIYTPSLDLRQKFLILTSLKLERLSMLECATSLWHVPPIIHYSGTVPVELYHKPDSVLPSLFSIIEILFIILHCINLCYNKTNCTSSV